MGGVILASRRSPLALRQTEQVAAALRAGGTAAEILPLSTRGDETAAPLADIGGKELFLDRLRQAVADGRADAAVHSLKDMPAAADARFVLAAVCFGEDARDAVVSQSGAPLCGLPPGAKVGTSGPRRAALLRRHFPALRTVAMRGNIQRRLEKLQQGDCDALLLAAAGLRRMGLQHRIAEYLPPEKFIPAVGQGILGIERAAASKERPEFADINDARLFRRAVAERAFAAALGGDCHTPLAAHATVAANGDITLRGFYADAGGVCYDASATATDAAQAGQAAAADIRRQSGGG